MRQPIPPRPDPRLCALKGENLVVKCVDQQLFANAGPFPNVARHILETAVASHGDSRKVARSLTLWRYFLSLHNRRQLSGPKRKRACELICRLRLALIGWRCSDSQFCKLQLLRFDFTRVTRRIKNVALPLQQDTRTRWVKCAVDAELRVATRLVVADG